MSTLTTGRPPVNAQNIRYREELVTTEDASGDRSDVRARFDCLLECPKPIVAAVNGASIS